MDARTRALLTANGQICTTSQLNEADVNELTVARLVRKGILVRIRRGLFASGPVWREASPEQQLALCTRAVLTDRPGAAASHMSAAVLHGLPAWGGPVGRVDVVCSTPRRRLRSGIGLHPWPAGVTPVVVDGQAVLPLPVAIVQVIVEHGEVPGLVCFDRALHERRVTIDDVAEAGDDLALGPRARRRLELAVDGCDTACESVGETRTRVLLTDLGLHVRSQVEIRDEGGFIGRVDFLVGDRVVVEFDGMVKYDGADGRRSRRRKPARTGCALRDMSSYGSSGQIWATPRGSSNSSDARSARQPDPGLLPRRSAEPTQCQCGSADAASALHGLGLWTGSTQTDRHTSA